MLHSGGELVSDLGLSTAWAGVSGRMQRSSRMDIGKTRKGARMAKGVDQAVTGLAAPLNDADHDPFVLQVGALAGAASPKSAAHVGFVHFNRAI